MAWGWRWLCGIGLVAMTGYVASQVGVGVGVVVEGMALLGLVALRASFLVVAANGCDGDPQRANSRGDS